MKARPADGGQTEPQGRAQCDMSIPPKLPQVDTPEMIRRGHLRHERSVRFVGNLYMFAGILFGVAAVAGLFEKTEPAWSRVLIEVLCLTLMLGYWTVGRWMCHLDSRAIIPATILAIIGLLGPCIGTIVNGWVLYLLHSQQGRVVFSSDYQTVRECTPQIGSGSFLVLWMVLILVLSGIVIPPLIVFLTVP
jgi:hypothetical protein